MGDEGLLATEVTGRAADVEGEPAGVDHLEARARLTEIDAELAHDDNDILSSVKERITEQVKDPTDRQLEVVRKIIADRQSDRARRETAHHVGQIKERREFTLTLLYTRSGRYEMPGVGPIMTYWSLFTDENGCKVACKSAPHLLGLEQTITEGGKWDDRRYEVGQTVNVAARVADLAGPGELLVTEDVVGALADATNWFRLVGPVRVKGVSEPVWLYRLTR